MADWLALHELSAEDCRAQLLPALRKVPHYTPEDPAFSSAELRPEVLEAMGRALPSAAAVVLARIRAEVRVNLSPDPKRFPRAFTLHDDGRGLPFISCPLKGRLSDLLSMAHELGHACQILASGRPDLTPLLRETAAYLAEVQVCAAVAEAEPDRGAVLSALHRARTARIMDREGRALFRALADPAATYAYGWNYPIARDLAARAARHLRPEAQWRIFTGEAKLTELSALSEA
jgi:hypothetical protein